MRSILASVPLLLLFAVPLQPASVAGAAPMDDECPCPALPSLSSNCSCTVQLINSPGYPVAGECEWNDPGCGLDALPCEWRGTLSIMCGSQAVVAKTFTLQTDCNAFPTLRFIKCTGGTGQITMGLDCEDCP